jgi:hypothetical protein
MLLMALEDLQAGLQQVLHAYVANEVAYHKAVNDMTAIGASSDKQQWSWNCYVHGRPSSADNSGTGHDIEDAKAKFREAWARIRAAPHGPRYRA